MKLKPIGFISIGALAVLALLEGLDVRATLSAALFTGILWSAITEKRR